MEAKRVGKIGLIGLILIVALTALFALGAGGLPFLRFAPFAEAASDKHASSNNFANPTVTFSNVNWQVGGHHTSPGSWVGNQVHANVNVSDSTTFYIGGNLGTAISNGRVKSVTITLDYVYDLRQGRDNGTTLTVNGQGASAMSSNSNLTGYSGPLNKNSFTISMRAVATNSTSGALGKKCSAEIYQRINSVTVKVTEWNLEVNVPESLTGGSTNRTSAAPKTPADTVTYQASYADGYVYTGWNLGSGGQSVTGFRMTTKPLYLFSPSTQITPKFTKIGLNNANPYTYTGAETGATATLNLSGFQLEQSYMDLTIGESVSGRPVTVGNYSLSASVYTSTLGFGTRTKVGEIASSDFSIIPRPIDLADKLDDFISDDYIYTGRDIVFKTNGEGVPEWDALQLLFTEGGKEFTADMKASAGDFTVQFVSIKDAGQAQIKVIGKGNFTGERIIYFTINPRSINDTDYISVESPSEMEYTGSPIKPLPTLRNKNSDQKLIIGGTNPDLNATYRNNLNVTDSATIILIGLRNYTGTMELEFKITPRPVTKSWEFSGIRESYVYTAGQIAPVVSIRDKNIVLADGQSFYVPVEGKDYEIVFGENKYVATGGTVTVRGIGNYGSEHTLTFQITKKNLAADAVALYTDDVTYTGNAFRPQPATVQVRNGDGSVVYSMTNLQDFVILSYGDNIEVATGGTIRIEGRVNFEGQIDIPFRILPRALQSAWLSGIEGAYTYTGSAITPMPAVFDPDRNDGRGVTLAYNKEYTLEYFNNRNVTESGAVVKVKGIGNYGGELSVSFDILPKELSSDWAGNLPSVTYTGYAHQPDSSTIVWTDPDRKAILLEGTDYRFVSYGENINVEPGGKMYFEGQGNYTGEIEVTFTINPKQLQQSWASLPQSEYEFTGQYHEPDPTVIDSGRPEGEQQLVNQVDYELRFENNFSVGSTARVVINGRNNYTGGIALTFVIVRAHQEFLFVDPTDDERGIRADSVSGADYEIPSDIGVFTFYFMTTAIYPNPLQATVLVENVGGGEQPYAEITSTKVEYYYGEFAGFSSGATQFSRTGVTMRLTGGFGTFRVTAYLNNENYVDSGDHIYTFCIKKAHSADVSDIPVEKTYGNPAYGFQVQLDSGRTDFTLTSSDPSILEVMPGYENRNDRYIKITGAGTATLTVFHPGYRDNDGIYTLSVKEEVEVTVHKRTMTIYLGKILSIPYGDTPNFTFTYLTSGAGDTSQGFPGSDTPESVLAGLGLSVNYDIALHKDVGTYDLMPELLINEHKNYVFEFVGSTITVVPAEVSVNVSSEGSSEIVYGDAEDQINFNLIFDGFRYGESVEDGTVDDYTPPAVEIPRNRFDPVGTVYTVDLKESGISARNYIFTIGSSVAEIQVVPAEVSLNLTPATTDYDGSGKPVADATVTGFEGVEGESVAPTAPIGKDDPARLSYRYMIAGEWTYDLPVNAGTYAVEVTFRAEEGDNYRDTVVVFESGLQIMPVAPVVSMQDYSVAYTSDPINTDLIFAVADAIENGSRPLGTFAYRYSADGVDYVSDIPVNAGRYFVEARYLPAEGDNYKEIVWVSKHTVIEVRSVDVNLSLDANTAVYSTADGKPVPVAAAVAQAFGVGNDRDTLPQDRISYEYLVNGNWVSEAPYNAGAYVVRVTYDATGLSNYNTTSKQFVDAVVIERYDLTPSLSLTTQSTDYSGSAFAFNAENHLSFVIPDGGSVPTGRWSFEYQANGAGNYMPSAREAAVYNVRVVYTPGNADNYRTTPRVFESALTIYPVECTIELLSEASRTANYSGLPVVRSLVSVSGISPSLRPRGEIRYEYYYNSVWNTEAPVDAGTYNIRVTYVSNDSYAGQTKEFAEGLIIVPVRPTLGVESKVGGSYTGQPFEVVPVVSGVRNEKPEGVIAVTYRKEGASDFSPELPVTSGIYDVRIEFRSLDGNYIDNAQVVGGAVNIAKEKPQITLEYRVAKYSGNAVEAGQVKVTGSTGSVDYLNGLLTIEYLIDGVWTLLDRPVNAGEYDVRVTFKGNSNFASASETFKGAISILALKVEVQPVVMVGEDKVPQFKVYDGQPVSAIAFRFRIEGDVWQTADAWIGTGALRAVTPQGTDAVHAGSYQIVRGTLACSSNYSIDFLSGEMYRIDPKEVTFIFDEIENAVYDNTLKTANVRVEGVIEGETLAFSVVYEGNRVDVTEAGFTASVSWDNSDYVASGATSRRYYIIPAEIDFGGIAFGFDVANDRNVFVYDGKPHSLALLPHPILNDESVKLRYTTPVEYVEVGDYTVTAVLSKPNYRDVEVSAQLKIRPGKLGVSVRLADKDVVLRYGDALPKLSVYPANSGTITFAEGTVLSVGTKQYRWKFVPYDSAHYTVEEGVIELTVEKALPDLILEGDLKQESGSGSSLNAIIKDAESYEGEVTITYIDANGQTLSAMPTEAGTYTVKLEYAGDGNYAATTATYTLVIEAPRSLTWLWIAIGVIIGLACASIVFFAARKKVKKGN